MVLRDLLRAHALSKEKAGARPGWKKKGAEPGYWTVLDHAEVSPDSKPSSKTCADPSSPDATLHVV